MLSDDELRALAEALGDEDFELRDSPMFVRRKWADYLLACANGKPVAHYAMLDSHRRLVERAIDDAARPSGMSTHDGKARIDASILRRMLAIIDSSPAAPQAEEPIWKRLRDAGFTERDNRITCDECGKRFTPQFLPIHKCEPIDPHMIAAEDRFPDAPQAEPKREPLTKAAQDVLAERRRQIEVEGWTLEHDDEHSLGEIAALAAFYAVPDGVHEWDFSSTGHGNTLAEALLPSGWTAKAGEDRRRDLVKAGALILAEIERLDRLAESLAEAKRDD